MATQCKGTTSSGTRCKRQVSGDSEYCYAHVSEDSAETSSAPETTNHRHAGRAVVR